MEGDDDDDGRRDGGCGRRGGAKAADVHCRIEFERPRRNVAQRSSAQHSTTGQSRTELGQRREWILKREFLLLAACVDSSDPDEAPQRSGKRSVREARRCDEKNGRLRIRTDARVETWLFASLFGCLSSTLRKRENPNQVQKEVTEPQASPQLATRKSIRQRGGGCSGRASNSRRGLLSSPKSIRQRRQT